MFFTISFYDDNVLSLIEIIVGGVLLEVTDHFTDTVQRGVEVGACFTAVACR